MKDGNDGEGPCCSWNFCSTINDFHYFIHVSVGFNAADLQTVPSYGENVRKHAQTSRRNSRRRSGDPQHWAPLPPLPSISRHWTYSHTQRGHSGHGPQTSIGAYHLCQLSPRPSLWSSNATTSVRLIFSSCLLPYD